MTPTTDDPQAQTLNMQFYVIALALIGVVAADVSHLQLGQANGYSYGSASASYASSSSSSSGHAAIPGGDSSSYQPAHLIPQHLPAASASQSINLGADTQTPEQFIPEADRIAHAQYVQEQQQEQAQVVVPGGDSSSYQPEHLIPQHLQAAEVETASAQFIPGGDSSSYQPEHLIPQHLKASHVQTVSTQVVLGADSSSYQPEHLIPQHLKASHASTSQSINLGADTQTPEQFIPEADRIAHYNYVHSQTQTVIPGGDSSSYQSASVTQSFNLGADTQTPEQFIPESVRIAHANYGQEQEQQQEQEQEHVQSADIYQEQVSNGIEEFNAETHVPVAIGRDTVTPAHLLPKYSAGISSSASSSASVGQGTQYGSNGGYVY